jgi:hypothetical protein
MYINKAWAEPAQLINRRYIKYFTPKITLITNGKKVYSGYKDFVSHLSLINQHLRGRILFPLKQIIIDGQSIVVRYDLLVKDDKNKSYLMNDMAIFSLHHHRISRWEEVVYSSYLCQPSSAKVVFSK